MKAQTVPSGLKIFTTASQPNGLGERYGIQFLARDFDDAKELARNCGLSDDDRDLGTLESIIEPTPDGPMTTWNNDREEA